MSVNRGLALGWLALASLLVPESTRAVDDVPRVLYNNPVAGFSLKIPADWEMASAPGGNVEIAIDAQPGAGLRAQPALWFFHAPNPPEKQAQLLARDLRLIGEGTIPRARRTGSGDEWEVTATRTMGVAGKVAMRWLCRREKGTNYVIGAMVKPEFAKQFADDIETAFKTCRLVESPILRSFVEPRENAYRLLLPHGWRWKGQILRTEAVPGYFTWEAESADGLTGCFTSPPGVFNIDTPYFTAEDAAKGVILKELRKKVPGMKLERVERLGRASTYFEASLKSLGPRLNPRFDKVRADYVCVKNDVRLRVRVDIVTLMQHASPLLKGRGDWFLFASGTWAPAARFDDLQPLARGVQASHWTAPAWRDRQRKAVGKVLSDRNSVIDEACKGWNALMRGMERVPDPDGGPAQEVPNRDGRVWKDKDGKMWRVPRNDVLEESLKNLGWKWIR